MFRTIAAAAIAAALITGAAAPAHAAPRALPHSAPAHVAHRTPTHRHVAGLPAGTVIYEDGSYRTPAGHTGCIKALHLGCK